jgi:hypothetical protein
LPILVIAMLPNLLVVGAMKSGTTSLHHYLSLHPQIFMSEDKEPTFFTVERNWHRGVPWYSSLFETDKPIRGESSTDYTKFPAIGSVPERIHSVVPDTRLVYLVREPVERIVSHYIDAYSFGRVHKSIDDELTNFQDHYFVNCSRYYMQLEQYLEYFEADRILVITSEELRAVRDATMRAVFDFLGVDPSFSSPAFEDVLYTAEEQRRNARLGYFFLSIADKVRRSSLRPYLSPKLMAPISAFNRRTARPIPRPELAASLHRDLVDYLRPDVERLRAFTGNPLAEWESFA